MWSVWFQNCPGIFPQIFLSRSSLPFWQTWSGHSICHYVICTQLKTKSIKILLNYAVVWTQNGRLIFTSFKEFIHSILPTALFVIKSHIPVALYELLYHKMFHSWNPAFIGCVPAPAFDSPQECLLFPMINKIGFFIYIFRLFIWLFIYLP